jgi:hypothetical protein
MRAVVAGVNLASIRLILFNERPSPDTGDDQTPPCTSSDPYIPTSSRQIEKRVNDTGARFCELGVL